MNIAVVIGYNDMDDSRIEAMRAYIRTIPEGWTVHTISGPVVDACIECYIPHVIALPPPKAGVVDEFARNVQIAKEVDTLIAFWDFHDSAVMSLITVCKIWGKKVIVNPHENGGIISPKIARPVAQSVEAPASNPGSEGSTPSGPTNGGV